MDMAKDEKRKALDLMIVLGDKKSEGKGDNPFAKKADSSSTSCGCDCDCCKNCPDCETESDSEDSSEGSEE